MSLEALAKRYALGFFEFCSSQNQLEEVYPFAKNLIKLFKLNPNLRNVLDDKGLGTEEKVALLEKLVQSQLPSSLKKFIVLLINRNRSSILYHSLLIFRTLYLKKKNILEVIFQVAESIDSKTIKAVEKRIKDDFKAECEIDVEVKPELIAGFTVIVNGKIYDSSVHGQLNAVKKMLLEKKLDN
ncbi:MAG: F-type H+-transporting ATPase subunit delta [Tenuifilum sp.]|jgi:F-type H+-transporting ATPase subunit delta|uniref:ATP synthase F1 subunit delta n=1 Tax=Tenuifilum sp. TaxID=2760880 RepID=UPI0024AA204F|nr:ATP synthase F1 subunit delta [Tenuifilum sp.]MDI3527065.1 F-type H+-transporting ATPase subunit delta [Tenuifilum sp.]